jgi:hypothetical protein
VAFFMTTFMCSQINWFGDLNTISPDENHEREVVDDSVITPKGVHLLTMGTINDLLTLFNLKP